MGVIRRWRHSTTVVYPAPHTPERVLGNQQAKCIDEEDHGWFMIPDIPVGDFAIQNLVAYMKKNAGVSGRNEGIPGRSR